MIKIIALAVLVLLSGCSSTGKNVSTARVEAASSQVQLARGYLQKGDLEIALEKADRALEFNPESVDALTVAAVINERIGRTGVAAEHMQRAAKIQPDNGDLLNNYGTLLHKLGRYDEAISYFDRALQQPFYKTPAAALTNAGASSERLERKGLAERYYRRALGHDEDNAEALFRLSRIMLHDGQALKARAFLQRLESNTQPVPEMLLLGIQIECAMSDRKAANRYAHDLRTRFPDSAQSRAIKESTEGELCQRTDELSAAST